MGGTTENIVDTNRAVRDQKETLITMESRTAVMAPLVALTVETESILGPRRTWNPVEGSKGRQQRRFLDEAFIPLRDEVGDIPELVRKVGWTASEINRFLEEQGFPEIKLGEFAAESFGVAAVLKLAMKWLVAGEEGNVTCPLNGQKYPAACIHGGVSHFMARGHEHPIVGIKTQSSDVVYMTRFDHILDKDGFDLLQAAVDLDRTMNRYRGAGIIFPMVDLAHEVDISWIIDMWTMTQSGNRAWFAQAKQFTRIQMNHLGARDESAAAAEIGMESCALEPVTIDTPFLRWVKRPGIPQPLTVSHIGLADWKNPGDLGL